MDLLPPMVLGPPGHMVSALGNILHLKIGPPIANIPPQFLLYNLGLSFWLNIFLKANNWLLNPDCGGGGGVFKMFSDLVDFYGEYFTFLTIYLSVKVNAKQCLL